ncbi:GNAT family N-acetyltransferase [Xylanimonas ulmi]|uniref:Ribosomal protein S18 acetylase RimI-like enzyme n=1 Tax=Xylanimonas ulmi TaxID=228973 RepID=A0A4Q7M321_9MICO|nr:GNAT family N-acetyltransferase [Xylanibacterium ulmi]RZS61353.1 ribosomal protein S18 acetylase RimI-like enzyme [Xylanibacterium ulmi]
MALFTSADGVSADVSVRPAVPGDEDAVTRVQTAAWRVAPALGDAVVDLVDADAVRARWAQAVTAPPGPGFAVLVALAGPAVVGFTAVAPGQLLALEVDPAHRRRGHGSRLLSAAVDRLRADGADAVVTWVLDGDEARERFLGQSGLGPDGPERALAVGLEADGVRSVVEHRWSALL